MKYAIIDLLRDEMAQGLSEYVLIMSFLTLATVLLLTRFGETLLSFFGQMAETLGGLAG